MRAYGVFVVIVTQTAYNKQLQHFFPLRLMDPEHAVGVNIVRSCVFALRTTNTCAQSPDRQSRDRLFLRTDTCQSSVHGEFCVLL